MFTPLAKAEATLATAATLDRHRLRLWRRARIAPMNDSVPPPPTQRHNPLHGLTLQAIVEALVAHYGWPGLADRIPLNCFSSEPSVPSSLKFLRKTPWAREKVEDLYLFMQREQRRGSGPGTAPQQR